MYLSFYLPLYSAEFVSKTHFVYKVAFFKKKKIFFTSLWLGVQLPDTILNLKSFRKLIKKSHTFPTIAFLRYLKEQWEFCNKVFNMMLMSSELVFFCLLVIMRRLPAFWLVCAGISCLGVLQRPENKMHSGVGFPFVVIEMCARYLDIINTVRREDLNIPTIFKSCFLKLQHLNSLYLKQGTCRAAHGAP